MTRKILYSPGYGAGWTTWESNREMKALMLEYQPIIEAIERGEKMSKTHPAVQQLAAECEKRFGEAPYLGGARQLQVATVSSRVRIEEYDGFESYEEEGEYSGWL